MNRDNDSLEVCDPVDHYRAYLFGPFRLVCAQRVIEASDWRRNKAKSLLKWFLLNPNQRYSVDQLCDLFWPAVPQKSAVHNLHVTVHYLRHMLEADLPQGRESRYLRRNQQYVYWLEIDDTWWVDTFHLKQMCTQADIEEKRGENARAYTLYQQVVQYCRRGFLPEDIYDNVFSAFRYQYDHLYIQVLEHLIDLSLRIGHHEETLLHTQLLLSLDPYNEVAALARANAYYRQGMVLKAMHSLDEFHLFLKQELGMEASGESHALRQQLAALA